MAMKPLVLPEVNRAAPKNGTKYYSINLDTVPKLHLARIIKRTWNSSSLDSRRLRINNVYTTFKSASRARAAMFAGFASNQ